MKKKVETKKLILIIVLFVVTLLFTWLLRFDYHSPDQLAGYWTLGDVGVYLSAALLGGPWGALVAAAASGLADIIVGQAIYAPASVVIKAVMAFMFAWYVKRGNTWLHLAKGVGYTGAWMVFGYFIYDVVIRGNYAIASYGLFLNILQVIASAVVAVPVLFLIGGKSYRHGEGFAGKNRNAPFGQTPSGPRNLK